MYQRERGQRHVLQSVAERRGRDSGAVRKIEEKKAHVTKAKREQRRAAHAVLTGLQQSLGYLSHRAATKAGCPARWRPPPGAFHCCRKMHLAQMKRSHAPRRLEHWNCLRMLEPHPQPCCVCLAPAGHKSCSFHTSGMLVSRHATSLALNAAQTDMKTASLYVPSAAAQPVERLF